MVCLLVLTGAVHAAEPVKRIQQMVDYRDAVSGGKIIDSSEYEEMENFARTLVTLAEELPDSPRKSDIQTRLRNLQALVGKRADSSRFDSDPCCARNDRK